MTLFDGPIEEVKHPETIHQDEAGWWFYDETWVDRHGPYPTREAAEEELEGYIQWLETGETKAEQQRKKNDKT